MSDKFNFEIRFRTGTCKQDDVGVCLLHTHPFSVTIVTTGRGCRIGREMPETVQLPYRERTQKEIRNQNLPLI